MQYNTENARIAKDKFNETFAYHDLCYLTDPLVPVTATRLRVHGAPGTFHLYEETANQYPDPLPLINFTRAQVISFAIEIYLPYDPLLSQDLYDTANVSSHEVHAHLSSVSSKINALGTHGFNRFASANNLIYLNGEQRHSSGFRLFHLSVLHPPCQ
ncbi:hypothetical protein DM01DRAFT_1128800 [Hesseltinella vesiculosa]|uniref:Uncharacterized protein n=1 Tax=Hesseltinella vesiculosa TaxID=101127 RepID=A0A1X2GUU0_9FUNG|nr:hypothetical protein DM01DRAFT_1128800 [Hesseltinella vesiculosa]